MSFVLARERVTAVAVAMMTLGLFVQLSGKVWLESNSAQNSQVYIWLLLPALLMLLFGGYKRCGIDVYMAPWACYLVWVALSVLWAENLSDGPVSLMKRGFFIALYIVAVSFFLRQNEDLFRRSLKVGITVIALGSLVSLFYQFFVLDKPLAYRAFRIDRSGIGDFANYGWPVAAGIFHGAIATWALGFALVKNVNRLLFAFWLTVFGVLVVYVLLTYTRGAWFGLLVSGFAVILIQNTRRGWLLFAASIVVSVLTVLWFWQGLIFEVTTRQLSGRGPIWEYFFSQMPGHWLLGHGLGTEFKYVWPGRDMTSPHAHSLYFQQIYDSGLISLVFLFVGLVMLFYKAWSLRDSFWVRIAFPALLFALVAMLTDVERIFTRPGDYWTVFWLPVAVLLGVSSSGRRATGS